MQKGGCWIFLSHSSHDIEKVRIIRNEFEKYSHNPLAFHLRCLNDKTPEAKAELDGLIRREIDSREWFVFCESPSAARSQYVRDEKEYILKQGKQKVWSLDMSLSVPELREKVRQICTLLKVYISYTRRDGYATYKALLDALVAKDFDVWDSGFGMMSGNFMDNISNAIVETAENGFAVVLVTEKYVHAPFCLQELAWIVESKAKIIPLVFGNARIPDLLHGQTCYRIPHIPTGEDILLIVELIETILESRIVGPIRYQADKLNKLKELEEKLNYTGRYHAQEAELVHAGGATDDYIEVYRFPCCGRQVVVGDGPVSRFRADGCCDGRP